VKIYSFEFILIFYFKLCSFYTINHFTLYNINHFTLYTINHYNHTIKPNSNYTIIFNRITFFTIMPLEDHISYKIYSFSYCSTEFHSMAHFITTNEFTTYFSQMIFLHFIWYQYILIKEVSTYQHHSDQQSEKQLHYSELFQWLHYIPSLPEHNHQVQAVQFFM